MNIEYKKIDEEIVEKTIDVYGEWLKKDKEVFVRDDGFAIAAMYGEIPVGFVCVTPRVLMHPLEHIKDAYIEFLEVEENYRRQGIGRHLINFAEDWAKKAGFKQIRTHSNG